MPILPSSSAPFGVVEPLHRYILNHASPLGWSVLPPYLTLPLLPILLQAHLAHYKGTQTWRLALGGAALAVIGYYWIFYRWTDSFGGNIFNNLFSVAWVHLSVKTVELAFLPGHYVDPFVAKGRPALCSAIDLVINPRMLFLAVDNNGEDFGSVKAVEPVKNNSNNKVKPGAKHDSNSNGNINGVEHKRPKANGHASNSTETRESHHLDRWIPPLTSYQSRSSAIIGHLGRACISFSVIDYLTTLSRTLAPASLGSPIPGPDRIAEFLRSSPIYLPLVSMPLPPLLVELVIRFCLGVAVWQGIAGCWHVGMASLLLAGWEMESVQVHIMDQPWKADSLLDIWGRRWHQVFRHDFILISRAVLYPFGLSDSPAFQMPIVFALSASFHILGEIAMDPVPPILPLGSFFIYSGFGCAAEVAFKKLTGRKVRGPAGRIWMWLFLLITARGGVNAWADSGFGGLRFGIPTPGRVLAPLTAKYLLRIARVK